MPSLYVRQLVGALNQVYIAPFPTPNIYTQIQPIGGLTRQGVWVPWLLNDDGTPVVDGSGGSPSFDTAALETTPGDPQTLVSNTVPDGVTRQVSLASVVTRVTGTWQLQANGEVIGSGRTGPAGTGPMVYQVPLPLAAGTQYGIIFQSRAGSSPQDVEAYVQASDVTN